MMNLNLSLQWKIFILYSILATIAIIGMSSALYFYATTTLTNAASSKMETSVQQISSSLDTTVDDMDTLSQTILFNKQLQQIMIDTISLNSEQTNYFTLYPDQKSKVNSILFSLVGVKSSSRRVSIFNGKQNYVSMSTLPNNGLSSRTDLSKLPYLKNLSQANGNAILLPPHKSLWSGNQSEQVFSFIRKFLYGNSHTLGYIEIEQPYTLLEKICQSAQSGGYHVIIIDKSGQPVYPIKESPELAASYLQKYNSSSSNKAITVVSPESGNKELLYSYTSPKTQWIIFQSIPQTIFMAPVYRIQQIVIAASIGLVILTLIIIYLITLSLTKPIRRLRKTLEASSVETPELSMNFKGYNNEINLFNLAYNHAIQKMQDSMNETIEARSKEAESHFLALQAQINPHFLYNSLMAISSVGLEYDNPKVVNMCTTLSALLRYTISNTDGLVNLRDEMNHTRKYIEMIKFRYEENFLYQINIAEELYSIRVPKLILQPLVENCFSHGFSNSKAPYHINITGRLQDGQWYICVLDNGCGFSDSALSAFKQKKNIYEYSLHQHVFNNQLQAEGMGLLNIYIRLRLLFKENLIFELCNDSETHGALVIIGGKC